MQLDLGGFCRVFYCQVFRWVYQKTSSGFWGIYSGIKGGSVAKWLACWNQMQMARVQIAVATLSGNSLRQTAHTN